ncbi:PaaI family thioesterase [Maribacter sp. 2307ULW6-5]|uniref:PaaI family thioesterase n=1 Tax=Maribacter sp. 2307ULW6-5 TaxID=3386275 RepID=UPI0039BC5D57
MMNPIVAAFKEKIGKNATDSISPLMRWLNPTLIEAEEGHLVFSHTVREEMTNPMHILHGGITAAIMDDAIGATVYSLNNSNAYTTVNLAVDYFSTAKAGDTLLAEAEIVKKGKQIMNAQCTVWNHDKSRIIAKGHSNLIRTKLAL